MKKTEKSQIVAYFEKSTWKTEAIFIDSKMEKTASLRRTTPSSDLDKWNMG